MSSFAAFEDVIRWNQRIWSKVMFENQKKRENMEI